MGGGVLRGDHRWHVTIIGRGKGRVEGVKKKWGGKNKARK